MNRLNKLNKYTIVILIVIYFLNTHLLNNILQHSQHIAEFIKDYKMYFINNFYWMTFNL